MKKLFILLFVVLLAVLLTACQNKTIATDPAELAETDPTGNPANTGSVIDETMPTARPGSCCAVGGGCKCCRRRN